jgi:lipopolysaccharide transport system permease protein
MNNQSLTVIEPPRGWQSIGIRELWNFRELLRALLLRDVKIRYKQTILGIAWAGLQPLVGMVVFTIALNGAAGIPSEAGVPYPIFCYSGLLIWLYFAEALNRASRSLVTNNLLVTKVYFPRLIAPLSGVIAPVLDFTIAFVILLGLMVAYGVGFSWTVLLAPLILIGAILCATAFGVWLAALNVEYRDIGYAVPLLVQLWLFLTPVVYPASSAHGVLRIIFALNPMAGVVTVFRWAVLGRGAIDWSIQIPSLAVLVVVLVAGILYFRRVETSFADSI